jgi:hypothetical protein
MHTLTFEKTLGEWKVSCELSTRRGCNFYTQPKFILDLMLMQEYMYIFVCFESYRCRLKFSSDLALSSGRWAERE